MPSPSSLVRLSAILLLATVATGCDRREQLDFRELNPPVFEGTDVVVRPVGDEGDVELRAGQVLAVEMKSSFDWREASPPVLLRQQERLGAPADRAGRDQGATGGLNWQVFVYRAVEPGEETLHFVEARGWEPDNITDRYDLTIRVRPATD
jgi:predicted secreted protein